jgi:hypothetical protein
MADPNNPLTPRINSLEQITGKNLIINSKLDFWQRGNNFDVFTSQKYAADRFRLEAGGSSTDGHFDKSTDVPNSSFENSVHLTQQGGVLSGVAQSYMLQPIESKFIEEYSGKTMTFSFWIKVDHLEPSTIVNIRLWTPNNGDDDYSTGASGRVSSGGGDDYLTEDITSQIDGTWKRISYTFTCPDFSVVNKGLAIALQVSKNNIATIVSEGIYTTGWMLHEGEEALDFQRAGRNYADELQLCQRYFCKSYRLQTPPGANTGLAYGYVHASATGTAANDVTWGTNFPVTMREEPSMTAYDLQGNIGKYSNNNTANSGNVGFPGIGDSGFTSQNNSTVVDSNIYQHHWTAEAEI